MKYELLLNAYYLRETINYNYTTKNIRYKKI